MNAKTRIIRVTLLLISAMAVVAACWNIRMRDKSLIRNAHRIGKLEGQTVLYTPSPEWISDHEAVFLSYHLEGDRFEFNRVNIDTGVSSPIDGLNERYVRGLVSNTYNPRSVPHPVHVPPNVALSPAHDLLLISPPNKNTTFGLPANHVAYHVTDLSGSRDIAWNDTSPNQDYFYPPLWLNDNNRCLLSAVPGSDVRASVYSVRSPRIHTSVHSINTTTIPLIPLQTTREDRIWGFTQKSFGAPINICIWDVGGTSSPESFDVHDPVNGSVWETALSNENSRVAWLMVYLYVPPVTRFRDRVFGSAHPILKNTSNTFGIWISDLHGNHMHELGHEQFTRASIFGDGYIRWLPGGKKLAFHIGGDLYTIHVDR